MGSEGTVERVGPYFFFLFLSLLLLSFLIIEYNFYFFFFRHLIEYFAIPFY